jgi:hypothetical protein
MTFSAIGSTTGWPRTKCVCAGQSDPQARRFSTIRDCLWPKPIEGSSLSRPFYEWLEKNGTWPRIGLLVVAAVGCSAGFNIRDHVTAMGATADPGSVLDKRFGYSPADARKYFELIGEPGRRLYAQTQWSIDLLFPAVYGALFLFLVVRLCPEWLGRRLMWLPIAAVAADYGENTLLTTLASCFAGNQPELARIASGFTVTKWTLIGLASLGLLVGAIWSAFAPARVPPEPATTG